MTEHHLNSDEFLEELISLKSKDLGLFFKSIYSLISEDPESVIQDDTPIDSKLRGLNKIISYYEKSEEYEKCQVIKNIVDRL